MGYRSRGGGLVGRDRVGAGGCRKGSRRRGITPRLSGDQTRQAVEERGEDRLLGGARRQVDLDLGFQLDDAGGEFDQTQSQGVELHDAPDRAFGHDASHRPQQPISAGMQEETELVGLGLVAGGAVGGEVVLPRLDMVLGLAARAIEPLIEVLGATTLEVGDMKRVSLPTGPTSTRAMMRSTRRQLSAAS